MTNTKSNTQSSDKITHIGASWSGGRRMVQTCVTTERGIDRVAIATAIACGAADVDATDWKDDLTLTRSDRPRSVGRLHTYRHLTMGTRYGVTWSRR